MNEASPPTGPHPWEHWLDEHGWKLLAAARQLLGGPADAEDLVQEVVVELWRKSDSDRPPDLPLVLHKLRLRAIDSARSATKRRQREANWQEPPGPTEESVFSSDREFHRQRVQRALDTLPPAFREVVSLKLWQELTFEQIADLVKAPRDTVASRYRLALAKLKPLLAPARHE